MPDTFRPQGPFSDVAVEVLICVGRAKPKVRELLQLGPDSILPLDSKVSDPVDLYVGDKLVARGELQELEGDQQGQLAVRLTEIQKTPGEE